MKQFTILLIGLITLSSTTFATNTSTSEITARYNAVFDGSKYVFVESGIEFSLFPDGEFDFYIPEYVQGVAVNVNAGPVGISFNTGYDYDPYVQYDEYGAVIQIEDTPLYYDNYGRLSQAGDVRINYRNNRVNSVGGLYVHYNSYGAYSHYTGFINVYNRNYVFHPYHNFFYRPVFNRCLVYTTPYRRYYTPIRYNYAYHRNNYYRGYKSGYVNGRRDFRRPNTGRVAHNNGRRDNVDRNNASFRKARTTTSRNNGLAKNNRRGTNTTRGNSKGIANNNSRGTNTTRENSKGIANNNSRGTNTTRGNSRGIANNNSRGTRTTRGNSRGVASASKSTNNRKTRTTTQRSAPSRKTTSTRTNSNRRTATKPSSSRNTRATSDSNRNTSKRTAQRSSSSKSKGASRSSSSRSSSSKSKNSRVGRS